MFRVEATSLEDYLAFDPNRRAELEAFDAMMRAHASNLERYFHAGTPAGEPGMRFRMIGYGRFHYTAASGERVAWPTVGLALQKNYISVYVSVAKSDAPVLDRYAATLKALRSGRNNFSFRNLSDLDRTVLATLLAEVAGIVRDDPANAERRRSSAPDT